MTDLETCVAEFNRDGCTIARGLFDAREMAEIEEHLVRFVTEVAPGLPPGEAFFEDDAPEVLKSAFRLHQHDAFFGELCRSPRITDFVKAFWDDEEIVHRGVSFFAKAAHSGSETPAHQDNAFQYMDPPEGLTATLALDASSKENGVLCCLRGSHKLGLLSHEPSGLPGFSQWLPEPPDQNAYPEIELAMLPGYVAFHASNAVHYSGPNPSPNHRRQLGLGYFSSRAKRDETAWAAYMELLEKMHGEKAGS